MFRRTHRFKKFPVSRLLFSLKVLPGSKHLQGSKDFKEIPGFKDLMYIPNLRTFQFQRSKVPSRFKEYPKVQTFFVCSISLRFKAVVRIKSATWLKRSP